jgi:RIO kinase 1
LTREKEKELTSDDDDNNNNEKGEESHYDDDAPIVDDKPVVDDDDEWVNPDPYHTHNSKRHNSPASSISSPRHRHHQLQHKPENGDSDDRNQNPKELDVRRGREKEGQANRVDTTREPKVIAQADRRYKRHERENRFLDKRSEDYQVMGEVFDMPTMMVITKMVNDGILKSVQSHFAAGKESKMFIAEAPDGTTLAVKIYLTVSSEFKKRIQYIAGDPRFSELKGGTRNFITAWARKEFKNLQQAHAAGVRVPAPIAVEKNVLVMEFIGDTEGNVAIPLSEIEDVTEADYDEVTRQLEILYKKAGLVHADMSEYNIFKNPKGEIVLLDFGSAVDIKHPNSKQFLIRDVQNVNRFFIKRGIDIVDTGHLIKKITGSE